MVFRESVNRQIVSIRQRRTAPSRSVRRNLTRYRRTRENSPHRPHHQRIIVRRLGYSRHIGGPQHLARDIPIEIAPLHFRNNRDSTLPRLSQQLKNGVVSSSLPIHNSPILKFASTLCSPSKMIVVRATTSSCLIPRDHKYAETASRSRKKRRAARAQESSPNAAAAEPPSPYETSEGTNRISALLCNRNPLSQARQGHVPR